METVVEKKEKQNRGNRKPRWFSEHMEAAEEKLAERFDGNTISAYLLVNEERAINGIHCWDDAGNMKIVEIHVTRNGSQQRAFFFDMSMSNSVYDTPQIKPSYRAPN